MDDHKLPKRCAMFLLERTAELVTSKAAQIRDCSQRNLLRIVGFDKDQCWDQPILPSFCSMLVGHAQQVPEIRTFVSIQCRLLLKPRVFVLTYSCGTRFSIQEDVGAR